GRRRAETPRPCVVWSKSQHTCNRPSSQPRTRPLPLGTPPARKPQAWSARIAPPSEPSGRERLHPRPRRECELVRPKGAEVGVHHGVAHILQVRRLPFGRVVAVDEEGAHSLIEVVRFQTTPGEPEVA